jgi:soluble lytic murein transglycosylase-like protein
MLRISLKFVLLLSISLNVPCAFADIYGYTDQDGVINLADTQSSDDYQLLVEAPIEPLKAVLNVGHQELFNEAGLAAFSQNLRFKEEVKVAAKNSGVETALLHAVITAESNYNSKAISPKGATGLMQLMPLTAKRFGVRNMYDPGQNIQGGALYLAYLLKLFNNDFKLAIAAYNAGENAVIQHGNKIPPYSETVNYVSKVMGIYKKLRTI